VASILRCAPPGEVPSRKVLLMTNHTTRRVRLITCGIVLAVAFTITPRLWAQADGVTPPAVPPNIQVPAGSKAFLAAHAVGTQDYICLPTGTGFTWTFFAPQATLFTDDDRQVITHFLSPDPFESGMPRPTWQDSRDTSTVRGKAVASSSDPAFVARDAIPWLLIEVTGARDGPTHGQALTKTTFVQRVNTVAGIAPSTGCALSTDVGKSALVAYKADYFFYTQAKE
jgi:hypothetical protein